MIQNYEELAQELLDFFKAAEKLPELIFDSCHSYYPQIEHVGTLNDLMMVHSKDTRVFQNNYNDWSYKRIEERGGFEGAGEECWVVYSFKKKGSRTKVLIKFDGNYQSYSGADYSRWCFVNRKVIKVNRYDEILWKDNILKSATEGHY